jgi:hypothetical protein
MYLHGGKVGEVEVFQARTPADDTFSFKALETFLYVSGVLGTALLAIVDYVYSGSLLPLHHFHYGISYAGRKLFRVKIGLVFPLP